MELSDFSKYLFRQPKGWKVKPVLERDPSYARYVAEMAERQRQNPSLRRMLAVPDGMSKEDFIFSLQPKSTQEIMLKQKDPDYKRDWSEPLPDNVIANPNARTTDELVGARNVPIDQLLNYELMRRRPKNSEGQSELSGAAEETKKRAAHHFQVTPPAPNPTDAQRITQLTSLKPYSPPGEEWKTLTTWQAFKHWLLGGKVEQRKDSHIGWQYGYWRKK